MYDLRIVQIRILFVSQSDPRAQGLHRDLGQPVQAGGNPQGACGSGRAGNASTAANGVSEARSEPTDPEPPEACVHRGISPPLPEQCHGL